MIEIKFWFRLEPRFDFDHSEIAPLSIRLFERGEVSRNSGRCKWTLCRLSVAFALLLTRCIWRTESFRVEQPPARNHPMALIPAMFGVQAGPGNSALYCVAMQD